MMNKTNEYNVRFLEYRPHYWKMHYIFEVHPKIAEFIRTNPYCSKDYMDFYLNADNQFLVVIESHDTDLMLPYVKEIERIANEKDYEFVINNLITDNGKFNEFLKVRDLLENEFDLKDRKTQLKVMSFFSQLQYLRFYLY